MHLAQDKDQWQAVVKTVMNLRVPYKAGNFLTSWVTIRFSGTFIRYAFSGRFTLRTQWIHRTITRLNRIPKGPVRNLVFDWSS
jgi:hypothetical protein